MLESLIITIIIGGLAWRLGSQVFPNNSLGLLWNVIVWVVGSYIWSWLLSRLGINLWAGYTGAILTGAVWAIVILGLVNMLFKDK